MSDQYTALADISCFDVGDCVAVGSDRASGAGGEVFQGLVETLADGAWTPTVLPDVSASSKNGFVELAAVSCPAPGACVAAGHYMVDSQPRYLVTTQSGEAWTASALPLPADATADQKWSQYQATSIGALACQSAGACVGTAGYATKSDEVLPAIETLSGRTWTVARAPLPADAAPGSRQEYAAYLQLVTCPAAGHCMTVGSYPAADGTTEGMIETAVPR